jgi:hypothetical protein
MNQLEKIVNYLYVGIVPNSTAAVCAVIGIPIAVEKIGNGEYLYAAANLFPMAFNIGVGLLKYAEYCDIKSALERHGWDERIVRLKMHSWCQRHAARQASKQLGYGEQFDQFAGQQIYD